MNETDNGKCFIILKKGDDFDNKDHCMYVIRKKALDEGFEFKARKSDTLRNEALEINMGCPIESFSQLPYYFYNLKMANEETVTDIETDDEGRFKMCFVAFGFAIRSFLTHIRTLLIIDGAHLKGTYKGTNLVLVGMDGNNNYTYFHRHLMMNCKLKIDKLQCIFWKTCKAYTPEEFQRIISDLQVLRPKAYQKLEDAGFETWSSAMCPTNRYNYMTSNSAESINNLSRHVRKAPITMLMEWYIVLLQKWYYAGREKYQVHTISDWATHKVMDIMKKSANCKVYGIHQGKVYQVDDRRKVHRVDLTTRSCTYRKWQLSGIPCGNVIAAVSYCCELRIMLLSMSDSSLDCLDLFQLD
nr:hypothetical protein [Tanacetum cinerariifolium]